MALTWQQAGVVTATLAATSLALTPRPPARLRVIGPVAREATIIAALYTLWQLAGTLSVVGTSGAFARAEWIERTERTLRLPAEVDIQHALTGNALLAQAANLYYAAMHFTAMFGFLLWLFLRHRHDYRRARRVLALTTFVCLAIQLVPVAPPRLLPGYVDTAREYGQSVYGSAFGGFGADQLSAMPSVHVAWAVLIGVVVLRLGRGPWRWLGPAHAVLTVVVVVATANHFWADGVVAVAVLALCGVLEHGSRAVVGRGRPQRPVLGNGSATGLEPVGQGAHPALVEAN